MFISNLLGLLQGEGLDWPEELVLRELSGLLSEHTRSIFSVLWQASQSKLPLHLKEKTRYTFNAVPTNVHQYTFQTSIVTINCIGLV